MWLSSSVFRRDLKQQVEDQSMYQFTLEQVPTPDLILLGTPNKKELSSFLVKQMGLKRKSLGRLGGAVG